MEVANDRRIRKRDEARPSLSEMRAVFHRLWGSQVGKDGYKKRDWQELQRIMFRLFKAEI